MAVNDPTSSPEPEPIIEPESADVSIEARIGAIEARLDALDAAFTNHEHVEYSATDHNHEPESPTTPTTGSTEDERPHAGHFWFRRVNE